MPSIYKVNLNAVDARDVAAVAPNAAITRVGSMAKGVGPPLTTMAPVPPSTFSASA